MIPTTTNDDAARSTSAVRSIGRVGIAAWTFIGVVLTIAVIVVALGFVAEVVIPVALAGLLAVVFKPASDRLVRRGLRPALAAGLVVIALGALFGGVTAVTIAGVSSQSAEISSAIDDAVNALADNTGIDVGAIQDARNSVEEASPLVALGSVENLVSGINSILGITSGILLGTLVFYYLLKDGTRLRQGFLGVLGPAERPEFDEFVSESCVTLRSYGRGRTILSAIVSAVVGVAALVLGLPLVLSIVVLTFVGGYIPYIGAFVSGAYAALIALGEGGVGDAVIIIVVSLAANLVLENFVEPKVMGRSLGLHPIVVIIVLALGGMLGGILGLILAVPEAAIIRLAFIQLRSGGYVDLMAAKARPVGRGFFSGSGELVPSPRNATARVGDEDT
jgi:predicted PurR-regulated permease PerM